MTLEQTDRGLLYGPKQSKEIAKQEGEELLSQNLHMG